MAHTYAVKKEKQFIRLERDNEVAYTFNLSTGAFCKGNTEIAIAKNDGTKIGIILNNDRNFFAELIIYLHEHRYNTWDEYICQSTAYHNISNSISRHDFLKQFLAVNEMLYNCGYITMNENNYVECVSPHDCNIIATDIKLFHKTIKHPYFNKDLNKWLKTVREYGNEFFNNTDEFLKIAELNEQFYNKIFPYPNWDYSRIDFFKKVIHYKKWFFNTINDMPFIDAPANSERYSVEGRMKYEFLGLLTNTIWEYLKIVDEMKITPAPIKSFNHLVTVYLETQKVYEIEKDKIKTAQLQKILADIEKKYFFENDDFITIFPHTLADFRAEAEAQGNCLYRFNYVDKMINGESIIVFIRRKTDLNTPYITCEIKFVAYGNHPYINQYLGKENAWISNGKAYDFQNEYSNYLKTLTL